MNNLKKVTVDCRMYGKNYGGIGRYVQEIVHHLIQQNNFQLTILANDDASEALREIKSPNLSVIACSSKMFSLREQIELFKKIPKCDIFWSPYINVPFLPIDAKKRIVTIHDVFHIANPTYYSFLKRKLISVYYFFSKTLSSKIITVSSFSKKEIENYFGENIGRKTEVVYNGCDIDSTNILARDLGSDYILFVGSIKPHKNLKKALLAFDSLENKGLKFVIVGKKEGFITGDDSVFDLVQSINKTESKILFTGNIDDSDLYSYYKGAKMLLMPSLYEGFGLPIVEAMKFEIPIACSDIDVFHEIGGEELFYFDPHSENDMKIGIEKALNSDKIKYKKYTPSWKTVSENINNIFLRV